MVIPAFTFSNYFSLALGIGDALGNKKKKIIINDSISRAFASVKIQVAKEPSGLFRTDGKRPDGLTLIPWQRGLSLTVATMLADSYISASASSAGAAAEMAASRKQAKCAALSGSYVFQLIALETLGPINESAVQFLNDPNHRITSVSTDDTEAQFFFQQLSIALQRFNAILLHESFGSDVDPDL